MSEETLSALFDGESTPAETTGLLESLDQSAANRRSWNRWWVAREALRGTPFRGANPEFAAGVMAALEREDSARVVPLRRIPRWQPLVGYAMAASIGLLSLLVLLRSPDPAVPVQAVADVAPQAPAALQPVASRPVQSAPQQTTRYAQLDTESAEQLNNYLIDHSGYGSAQGMGGLGYARYAAHTAEYRPGSQR